MMFRGRFLIIGLLGLLLLGGFASMGRQQAYHQGWMQGYYAGQQASSEGSEAVPAAPFSPQGRYGDYGRFHHGWGFSPIFWGIASFLKCILVFLILGFIFRLFFGRHPWRHGWAKRGGPWGHGPWKHHHHGKWESEPIDDTVYKA